MLDLTTLRIESERLLLVPITMEYAEDVFREFQEPVTRFMEAKPADSIEELERRIVESIAAFHRGSEFNFTILKKETREFLGRAGFHEATTAAPEVGLWIKQSAHGNGYGREAMHALVGWIRKNFHFTHLRYDVARENTASIKMPESFGAKVMHESEKTMQSGRTYHMLQYWIPKKEAEHKD